METCTPDKNGTGDGCLSELLPAKTSRNMSFAVDYVVRYCIGEMQDFMECIAYDREP